MSLSMKIPAGLKGLLDTVRGAGGHPFVVGGAVRDALFGRVVQDQDWDVEVFGLASDSLEEVLRRTGRVDAVGQSFRVFKVTGLEGVTNPLEETISSFDRICNGEGDDLPENSFMYVGSLEDARAKAERMAAEAAG